MQPKYKRFVRWYQKNFKHNIKNIKIDYYIHLEQIHKVLPFLEWFITTYFDKFYFLYIKNKNYDENSSMVVVNHVKTWNTTDSKTIQSIHPPTAFLAIKYSFSNNGKPITFEITVTCFH